MGDRFMLNRRNLNIEESNYWLGHYTPTELMNLYIKKTPLMKQDIMFAKKIAYNKELAKVLDINEHCRILSFAQTEATSKNYAQEYEKQWPVYPRQKPVTKPQFAVLDLPNIKDDFKLNVVHWGISDYIAAALESTIYLWHVPTSTIAETIQCRYLVTAVKLDNTGFNLAISLKRCTGKHLVIFNMKKVKVTVECKLNICDHTCSFNTVDWHLSDNYLAVGCSKGNLAIVSKNLQLVNSVSRAHETFPIIKVKFSPNGRQLASCGNDGKIKIWSVPSLQLIYYQKENYHTRGLAWHPWKQSYLCYGTVGGDLVLMNTSLGKTLNRSEDRNTIIYDISFNKISGELVTSHTALEFENGRMMPRYWSQINVLARLDHVVDRFIGHSGRILYLEWNPDGSVLATAGSDETIYLWKFIENTHKCLKKKNITIKTYNFI